MSQLVGKLKDGDTFRVGDGKYRAMVKQHDAWGCRIWDGESWCHTAAGGYYWFTFDTKIEWHEEFIPKLVAPGGESVDPMAG